MRRLAKAGAEPETDTELGADEYTKSFLVQSGVATFQMKGDFSGQTVTLEVNPNGKEEAEFTTYVARDSGVPTSVTYTEPISDAVLGPGQTFRFHCSDGGTPDIDFFVAGDVRINE